MSVKLRVLQLNAHQMLNENKATVAQAANMGCPASRALHAERALQPRGQLLARAASRLRLCLVRLA